ncbi:MAG TPA: AEC family transporter [Caulobacter sp.]|nr:AEC family transporter [Caulobacter sp.]
MSAILLGVLPVFAMIALGWGLKASKFIPEEHWPAIERITYFVFYPGFLAPAVWKADFSALSAGPLAVGAIGGLVVVALVVLLAKPLLRVTDAAYTSVFQGSLRWNAFVFLPLVAVVYGPEGAALGAMILGALIPTINVISVLVMSRWGEGQGGGWRPALRGLVQNPVLWGCGVGALLNVLHAPKLPAVMNTLDLLSHAALTLGLIVAGAGLNFAYVRRRRWLIVAVSAVKLLILPILMWTFTGLAGGDGTAQGIALLVGSAPGAAASYVLARQMGGDAPLMAGIVAFTTAASLLTIPALLLLFRLP